MREICRDALNLVIIMRLRAPRSERSTTYLQPGNEHVVGVEIRNQLEPSIQGDDLPFDVLLKYAA